MNTIKDDLPVANQPFDGRQARYKNLPLIPWIKEYKANLDFFDEDGDRLQPCLPVIGWPVNRDTKHLEAVLRCGETYSEFWYIRQHTPLWKQRLLKKKQQSSGLGKNSKKVIKWCRIPARYFYSSGMLHPGGWKTLAFKNNDLITYQGLRIGLDPSPEAFSLALHKLYMKDLLSEFGKRVKVKRWNNHEFICFRDYNSYLWKRVGQHYQKPTYWSNFIGFVKEVIYFITGLPIRTVGTALGKRPNIPGYAKLFNYGPRDEFYRLWTESQRKIELEWKKWELESDAIEKYLFHLPTPTDAWRPPINLPRLLMMCLQPIFRFLMLVLTLVLDNIQTF
jgi:hypothetical protein